jgi:hypothetical protein
MKPRVNLKSVFLAAVAFNAAPDTISTQDRVAHAGHSISVPVQAQDNVRPSIDAPVLNEKFNTAIFSNAAPLAAPADPKVALSQLIHDTTELDAFVKTHNVKAAGPVMGRLENCVVALKAGSKESLIADRHLKRVATHMVTEYETNLLFDDMYRDVMKMRTRITGVKPATPVSRFPATLQELLDRTSPPPQARGRAY